MPDAQAPTASPNLWQTTLTENPAPSQRRPTHTGATSDQATKEKQSRTMRRTGAQAPPSPNVGDIPDAEVGHSWLTEKGLLAPSGSTPSLAALAETLFQVGVLPNTPL